MYFKLAGLLAALSLGIAGYYYVNNLTAQVANLSTANALYVETVRELKFSMDSIRDDIATDRVRMDAAYESMKKNKERVTKLSKTLAKHDLQNIIQSKPKLFEKAAQKGTDKYYRDLEELSKWLEQ